jgi:hypothetical protein
MKTSRIMKLLGGAAGVNLVLALAVSAGAVPRPGDNADVHTVAAAQVEEVAAPAPARQPGDVVAEAAPAPAAPADTPTTAAPATTVAQPKVTTPPTTKAPKPKATTSAPAPAAPTAAPAPAAPVAPVVAKVARRVPTAAEIQNVIAQLKKQVTILTYISITPAQIDQIGDQVCTAFYAGQTVTQVKSTALSMIPSSIKVSAATTDWAVRQAVTLYCPGHANKLV